MSGRCGTSSSLASYSAFLLIVASKNAIVCMYVPYDSKLNISAYRYLHVWPFNWRCKILFLVSDSEMFVLLMN